MKITMNTQINNQNNFNNSNFNTIDPYYISGLTQADGSFFCGISKVNKNSSKTRLRFKPVFTIVVDLDSKQTLDIIQEYFGCGHIEIKISEHSASFIVTKLNDLNNIIIPHFKIYPVFFNKLHSFNLLVQILGLLNKKHKDRDNVSILNLAISMNEESRRTDEEITELFNILVAPEPYKKPIVKLKNNITKMTSDLTPGFLAGLIDGDGSFNVPFLKNGDVLVQLTISFGLSCLPLIEESKMYLGGSMVIFKNKSTFEVRIRDLNSIISNVIPFMNINKIHTEKKEHYEIWKEVCLILYHEKGSLSKSSFKKIVDLAYNMNKGGKRRKLTKEEYLELNSK